MRLHSLSRGDLNGRVGTAGQLDAQSGRVVVLLDGDESARAIRVRRENLVLVFPEGTAARLD